jgi:signal transduction histidine kinase
MLFTTFSSYVFHLQNDAMLLTSDASSTFKTQRPPDAIQAGKSFVSTPFRSDLLIVFIDGAHRVCVMREPNVAGIVSARISVRARFDRSGEPHVADTLSRVIIGVGAAFGLQTLRAHVHDLEIDVSENPRTFAASVEEYAPIVGWSLLFILVFCIIVARVLAYQSLRQLIEVTAALQHLAIGDFTPQFVTTGRQGQLRALASAYNGAVDQVQKAFAERDRAHASMQRFISDAAHQLRTPLTVIRGYIGILRHGNNDDTPSILTAMNQQCVLIGALIERLILLEQWEKETSEPVNSINIGDIAHDVLSPMIRSQANRRIIVDAAELTYAAIDPTDFGYALTNIVENALKYTAGQVTITVRAKSEHVLVRVSDTGPGMTPEQATRAFDRFFRGNRRDVEGSGLGLAIAKRAVERAGGSILLETGTDRGSVFTITLRQQSDTS